MVRSVTCYEFTSGCILWFLTYDYPFTIYWLYSCYNKKVKVKVTLVQAPRLCRGRTAHRGSRGIALPFHDHGTRRGWGVSVTSRLLFTSGKNLVPIVEEAGWAPGPVWTGVENLAPTGIWSPDRPAHSHLLYQLSYPAHPAIVITILTHLHTVKFFCLQWIWITSQSYRL